jgi:hypothetical protein
MGARQRRGALAGLALAILCALGATFGLHAGEPPHAWHFAANNNFDAAGAFLPSSAGFNLADVSSRRELDQLPRGAMGLVWVGLCEGVTPKFKAVVGAVINHPKTFGFYLVDDPDPTGRWRAQCKPSDLRAESDWIHRRRPAAMTFVGLMNLGSSVSPSFSRDYRPAISHIDLFGVPPYPCRTGSSECDYDMIDRFVRASRDAGIPPDRVVPTFQSFGGGEWRTDSGDAYRLPTPSELQVMLERWNKLVPSPVFDYAYSWGSQRSDLSLADATDLKSVFAQRNHGTPRVKVGEGPGDSSASAQREISPSP